MQAWWESLSDVLRVLYCIAVPSTLILFLQVILAVIAGGAGGDADVSDTSGLDDVDLTVDLDGNGIPDALETPDSDVSNLDFGGGLRLLTLQTIMTCLTVFGWVSIICISSGIPVLIGCGAGLVLGILMMFAVAKMVQLSRKLAENGAINLRNAIGQTATVYVTIPENGGGTGKITMRLQGRFGEFDAVSDGEKPIESGTEVLVIDVQGDEMVVERNE